MHTPNVLVLLASYNGAKWINDQLTSILAQKCVHVRVVIRDDGSSDTTLKEIARFAADERIQVAPSSAPTGSAAQNFFCLLAEFPADGFDFVAFSDQDDIWYEDKLSRACRMLLETGAAGYSSATLARWESGRERLIAQSQHRTDCDFLFEGAGQGCTFVLSAEFYEWARRFILERRDITRKVHFHDWTIYALARSQGLPWAFDPAPTVMYRQHSGNDTGARGSFTTILRRLGLIRNGWYRQQLEQICLLCSAAAPDDFRIAAWRSALLQEQGYPRTAHLTCFSLRRGRRKVLDRLVVAFACLVGWI